MFSFLKDMRRTTQTVLRKPRHKQYLSRRRGISLLKKNASDIGRIFPFLLCR
jgi:hypothetical protein